MGDKRSDKKSIKEFFLQKAQETSASEEEKATTPVQEVKKEEKDKKIAIENNFGANKGYLTAFESFIKKDKSPKMKSPQQSPPKQNSNRESEKAKKKNLLFSWPQPCIQRKLSEKR